MVRDRLLLSPHTLLFLDLGFEEGPFRKTPLMDPPPARNHHTLSDSPFPPTSQAQSGPPSRSRGPNFPVPSSYSCVNNLRVWNVSHSQDSLNLRARMVPETFISWTFVMPSLLPSQFTGFISRSTITTQLAKWWFTISLWKMKMFIMYLWNYHCI